MAESTRNPQLEPMNGLVGAWTVEATHPAYPSLVVAGVSTFEWLEGERFLIQRSRNEHPDFPDSIGILGAFDEALALHYYDSRGVHRIYEVSFGDGAWSMSRDAPGFSQRFTGTFGDGGDTLSGLWKLSEDGSSWADDLAITFRKVG
jgi:hypothetical protein